MTTRNELAEQRATRLPDEERQLYESFCRMGMSPAAALTATRGRGSLASTDPAEEFVEALEPRFRRAGRSSAQARRMAETAARGRERSSLREISESLSKTEGRPPDLDGAHTPLTREERKVRDSLTREERERLSEAAQRLVDDHRLGRRFGSDAHRVAERALLKAAIRRMEDSR